VGLLPLKSEKKVLKCIGRFEGDKMKSVTHCGKRRTILHGFPLLPPAGG